MGTFVTEEPELTGNNVTAAMTDREKLLQILDKPIFPRTDIDPLEAVTDYLLDNDVVPVVRCKYCKFYDGQMCLREEEYPVFLDDEDYCSFGERREKHETL